RPGQIHRSLPPLPQGVLLCGERDLSSPRIPVIRQQLSFSRRRSLASFCRKTQNSPSNQSFVQIFSDFCIFPLTCICVLWHIYPHENSLSGVPCRGLELVSV